MPVGFAVKTLLACFGLRKAQSIQHDANLFFGRKLATGLAADLFDMNSSRKGRDITSDSSSPRKSQRT
jgi:hypothetical protein